MFTKFLKGYYFHSAQDFLTSLVPSSRYHITMEVFLLSSWGAMVQLVLGFSWLTMVAFIVAALAELISGVYASVVVKKEKLQSGRMGRFAIKILIWFTLFFFLNTLVNQWVGKSDTVAGLLVYFYNLLIIWCAGEYVISILENASTISGQESSALIEALKAKLSKILDL